MKESAKKFLTLIGIITFFAGIFTLVLSPTSVGEISLLTIVSLVLIMGGVAFAVAVNL